MNMLGPNVPVASHQNWEDKDPLATDSETHHNMLTADFWLPNINMSKTLGVGKGQREVVQNNRPGMAKKRATKNETVARNKVLQKPKSSINLVSLRRALPIVEFNSFGSGLLLCRTRSSFSRGVWINVLLIYPLCLCVCERWFCFIWITFTYLSCAKSNFLSEIVFMFEMLFWLFYRKLNVVSLLFVEHPESMPRDLPILSLGELNVSKYVFSLSILEVKFSDYSVRSFVKYRFDILWCGPVEFRFGSSIVLWIQLHSSCPWWASCFRSLMPITRSYWEKFPDSCFGLRLMANDCVKTEICLILALKSLIV